MDEADGAGEGEEPQEDADVILASIESAQKILDELKNKIGRGMDKTKSMDILSNIQHHIEAIAVRSADEQTITDTGQATEPAPSDDPLEQLEPNVKSEPVSLVGTIKVRNLSSLMDPERQSNREEEVTTIVLSSDDETMLVPDKVIRQSPRRKPSDKENGTLAMPSVSSDNVNDKTTPVRETRKPMPKFKQVRKQRTHVLSTSGSESDVEPVATPTKSILKNQGTRVPSPEKKVQFSKEDASVHTYLPQLDSSSSSDHVEDSSDEVSFTVRKTRSKSVTKKQTPNVKCNPVIRQDKKYFSKCVVKVARLPNIQSLSLSLKQKGGSWRVQGLTDDMNTASRRRGQRSDSQGCNPSDEVESKSSRDKKKKKKKENSDSDSDQTLIDGESKTSKKTRNRSATGKNEELKSTCDTPEHSVRREKPRPKSKQNKKMDESSSENKRKRNSDAADEVQLEVVKKLKVKKNGKLFEIESSSDSEAGSDKVLCNTTKENESEIDEREASGSDDCTLKPKAKRSKMKSTKKTKFILSDSDDNADEKYGRGGSSGDSSSNTDSESEEKSKPSPKQIRKRSRIKKVADSSDEEEEKSTRKQIRKVIAKESLAESTKEAERAEAERKARIAERQEKYNNIFDPKALENSQLTKVVLDFNEETQEELLSVDPEIVQHLKPHQAKGVQFMWNACYESLDRAVNTKGSGCILAHCMGLGKTLQVIALIHTLMVNEEKTKVRKVLVVCPLSTVLNWVAEFKQWLPDDDYVQVYNLVALKQNRERAIHVLDWHKHGGVLVLGYDMFRNLSNETNKRISKKMRNDFKVSLVEPGPDLVICDEGHLLKNEKTSLSKAMNHVQTLRRVVLTGTPLQNNLKEYYCMVQFVKPNLLGTYKEYLNRFVNPITNGQYTDSTAADIILMRRRSHVLHKLLDGTVQRRDYAVLAPFLPPKHEYVIFVSLTLVQRNLYQHYLSSFAQRSSGGRTSFLFTDFQEFQRICTHPRVMLDKSIQNKLKADKKEWEDDDESEGSLKEFIDDGSGSESDAKSSSSGSGTGEDAASGANYRRRTRAMAEADPEPEVVEEELDPTANEWWRQFTPGDELDNIIHSGKLILLFEILQQSELIGDKVLVFSQSLLSLNVIEYFLSKIDEAGQTGDTSMLRGYSSSWALGLDYFRLDGSSSCDNRALWCKSFNDPNNTRARLFLISTRAGGLGINLVAANRVIIFDVSWNPSHDIQSIYRVYRFGQTKPSFIYRFVTLGTMEMKVYERQVTKQAISKRVIDEQQIDRHYNQNDLQELYKFEPQPGPRPPPIPPKDILLGELLQSLEEIIFKYHEHQSLLENKEDETLNEEERKAAWEEFENEKRMQRNTSGTINNIPMHIVIQGIMSMIRREHPTLTDTEIHGVIPPLISELRGQVENGEMTIFNKMMEEVRTIKAAEHARIQEYYHRQQRTMLLAQQMQQQFGMSNAEAMQIIQLQMNNAAQLGNSAGGHTGHLPMQQMPTMPPAQFPHPNEIVNLDED